MQNTVERKTLEKYAKASNQKAVMSLADLDPKDKARPEMLNWCKRQGTIVVLSSGMILTSEPSSRMVQNCKIVMINKGFRPRSVAATRQQVIDTILANAEESLKHQKDTTTPQAVSVQQQRLRMLVQDAVNLEASDIHIEVRQDVARILFRQHGELILHAEWAPKLGREVASVAFNKETDQSGTHFNPSVPQNGSMPLEVGGKQVRLRLASLPAHGGFDIVFRILATDDKKIHTLEELGYTVKQVRLIKKAVMLPHGAVIVSGPTGSGKTTTLAACISTIKRDRKTYTIEDPVEKIVKTATQVPVNTDHYDRDFASMGRSALRMDPDIIVLGEMRDEKTATVMTRAAITGHLVFSTLHTNTASAIVTRLIDMGISPALLSDPHLLACLICQRLIPKLCEHCSRPLAESPEHKDVYGRWQQVLGDDLDYARVRGKGCDKCDNRSITRRTVVAEVLWVDDKSREFIQKNDMLGWEKHLRAHGFTPYRDHAIELVKQGKIDIIDAEKAIGQLDPIMLTDSFDYSTLD